MMKRSSVQGTFLLLNVPASVLLVWLLMYTSLYAALPWHYPLGFEGEGILVCFAPIFLAIGIALLASRRSLPISRTLRTLPFLAVAALSLITVMDYYLDPRLTAAIGTAIALFLCVVFLVFMVKDFARVRKQSVPAAKWMTLARVTLYSFLTLLIIGVASYIFGGIHWDGAYANAEYQIVFSDRDGNALPGVTLKVQDESAYPRFNFPVTDFRVLRRPRSDENGLLTFHHLSRGIEFGGTMWNLFFLIPINMTPPRPVYHCEFLYDGQEVYSIKYGDLDAEVDRKWDELPRVRRTREELGLEPYETDRTDFEFPVLRRNVVVAAVSVDKQIETRRGGP